MPGGTWVGLMSRDTMRQSYVKISQSVFFCLLLCIELPHGVTRDA
jgi:hypothetical protein